MYIYNLLNKKVCVYNKKACICVCGGCLDKYISVATWPPQTKIPGSVPGHYSLFFLSVTVSETFSLPSPPAPGTLYFLLIIITIIFFYKMSVYLFLTAIQFMLLDHVNPWHWINICI